MRRRILVVLMVVGMVMAINVGAAFAHHDNGVWEDCTSAECAPHWAPVGQHLLNPEFPGRDGLPGGPLDDPDSPTGSNAQAAANIGRNPNCPAHWS